MKTATLNFSYVDLFRHQVGFTKTWDAPLSDRPGVLSTLKTWTQRSRQRDHLAGLEQRLLADVGLNRADLETEFNKPFWRA